MCGKLINLNHYRARKKNIRTYLRLGRVVGFTGNGGYLVDFPDDTTGNIQHAWANAPIPCWLESAGRKNIPVLLEYIEGSLSLPIIKGIIRDFLDDGMLAVEIPLPEEEPKNLIIDGGRRITIEKDTCYKIECGSNRITIKGGIVFVIGRFVIR